MTSKVTVHAHAGWPIDVVAVVGGKPASAVRVEKGAEQVFYVHSTQDLHIHEVQPHEAGVIAGGVVTPTGTDRMLQFFAYKHLPERLQAISRPFGELAQTIVDTLPSNAERTVGLRKLLEAKDCAVRAHLYKDPT